MLYRVIDNYNDAQDGGENYKVNHWYPRYGYEPSDERVQELLDKSFIEKPESQNSDDGNENTVTEPYTAENLKKLSADEQKELVEERGGDLEEITNAEKRIAFILEKEGNKE